MKHTNIISTTSRYKMCDIKEVVCIEGLFLLMILVLTMILMNMNLIRTAKGVGEAEKINREKVVTTVYIEKNSTLWDIASKYYTEEYRDLNDMIEEIKRCNGMVVDTIHEGSYLIVPHYVNCDKGSDYKPGFTKCE